MTNLSPLLVGQTVWVRAWWTHPEGEIVECEVSCPGTYWDKRPENPKKFCEVRPKVGNRHVRFINRDLITARG